MRKFPTFDQAIFPEKYSSQASEYSDSEGSDTSSEASYACAHGDAVRWSKKAMDVLLEFGKAPGESPLMQHDDDDEPEYPY